MKKIIVMKTKKLLKNTVKMKKSKVKKQEKLFKNYCYTEKTTVKKWEKNGPEITVKLKK